MYLTELYVVSLSDDTVRIVSGEEDLNRFVDPVISPDNQRIAFSTLLDPTIFIMNIDSQALSYLTDYLAPGVHSRWEEVENSFDPNWSPAGDKLVFAGGTRRSYQSDIYILDLESGRLEQLTRTPANEFSPDWWSP